MARYPLCPTREEFFRNVEYRSNKYAISEVRANATLIDSCLSFKNLSGTINKTNLSILVRSDRTNIFRILPENRSIRLSSTKQLGRSFITRSRRVIIHQQFHRG